MEANDNADDVLVLEFQPRNVSRQVLRSLTPKAPADRREPLWRELAGRILRSERVERGLTLRQVADRAGVSPQYLSEVERGRKDPSSEMLESICGALGLRLGDLLASSTSVLVTRARRSTPSGRPTGVTMLAA